MTYWIEGSEDGKTWVLYAKSNTLSEARVLAAKCITHTKHMAVRISTSEYLSSTLPTRLRTNQVKDKNAKQNVTYGGW
jgi:hypothetical protein